jgi:tripartite-type tricarboxylate transporter receptor subunit TctC
MQIASGPNVLVVHPSVPAKSTAQLVALARREPGKLDFASSGNGSAQHLFGALFASMAGIRLNHVPYKGSAQATSDLIGGQVSVGFPGIALALPHTKAGRLRPLGVTSAQRSRIMPDVPSLAEGGVSGYEATLWLALLGPRGTPAHVIERLDEHIGRILRTPTSKRRSSRRERT